MEIQVTHGDVQGIFASVGKTKGFLNLKYQLSLPEFGNLWPKRTILGVLKPEVNPKSPILRHFSLQTKTF